MTPAASEASQLTSAQSRVLEHLKGFIGKHGFPPTRKEVADALGFKSTNAAEQHLQVLQRKGLIHITRGVSRGIRLVEQP